MHWEPLGMALLLAVLGTFMGMAFIGPTVGPSRRIGSRSSAADFIWKRMPEVYGFYEKFLMLVGCVAMFAGAAYCVKLALTPW